MDGSSPGGREPTTTTMFLLAAEHFGDATCTQLVTVGSSSQRGGSQSIHAEQLALGGATFEERGFRGGARGEAGVAQGISMDDACRAAYNCHGKDSTYPR